MTDNKCIICGKEIPEYKIEQGKRTCCRACSIKATMSTDFYKAKRSKISIELWKNNDYRKSISNSIKEAFQNPETKEKHKQSLNKIEVKQKISEASKAMWQSKVSRAKLLTSLAKVKSTESYKAKASKSAKAMWQNEEYRNKISLAQSKHSKEMWQNEDHRQKVSHSCKIAWSNKDLKQRHSEHLKYVNQINHDNIETKKYQTMKQNGTFVKSKSEDYAYELLLTKFDEKDIKRQYLDKERYPFKCDFYIKSLDLFIECHYSEFHQCEPFDSNNDKHIKRFIYLQTKADEKFNCTGKESRYHKMIYTWTDLDVRKTKCVKDNHLNWIAFYSLEEFERWLNENKI